MVTFNELVANYAIFPTALDITDAANAWPPGATVDTDALATITPSHHPHHSRSGDGVLSLTPPEVVPVTRLDLEPRALFPTGRLIRGRGAGIRISGVVSFEPGRTEDVSNRPAGWLRRSRSSQGAARKSLRAASSPVRSPRPCWRPSAGAGPGGDIAQPGAASAWAQALTEPWAGACSGIQCVHRMGLRRCRFGMPLQRGSIQ